MHERVKEKRIVEGVALYLLWYKANYYRRCSSAIH